MRGEQERRRLEDARANERRLSQENASFKAKLQEAAVKVKSYTYVCVCVCVLRGVCMYL